MSTHAAAKPSEIQQKDKDYDAILSVALDQSNVSTAQSLIDNTLTLLLQNKPDLAWECYKDLTCRNIQKYISREQYKKLIKYFNHTKPDHEQGLEYVLTLVEDMQRLGYQVGRKEKLLVMRLLGLNGQLTAMEKVFHDLSREELFLVTDLSAAQKPFNIMLTSYQGHVDTIGADSVAEKSMDLYGQMLDRNIQPAGGTTRLLMENVRLAHVSDEMVEKVWNWVWTKIGMNVGGKAKDLDPALYRDMVMYFASAGRLEYALEINDIMTKKKIDRTVRMMTALIHKAGRSGDVDKAMDLFNQMMIVDGLVPNIITFNALIDVHAHKKAGPDVAGAIRIFDMLNEVGLQPDNVTFGTLIDMYAKKGDLASIKELYNDMIHQRKIQPSPHIYSSLIECFITLNDRNSAMDVLSVLKKQANRRAAPAREAYNLMFKGLIQSDHIVEALDLLDVMTKDKMYLEPRTFTPLLLYYAKQGDTVGTHKVATMMTQANVKPNSHTYSLLLESFAKAGDIEGAENIFNIYKQKYRPNAYVYNALLYVYTKRNELDKVLDTYKRMSKAFVPANEYTYGILMYFYSKRKEVSVVEALMNTMQSNNIIPSAICWTILMQTYFDYGKPEQGRNVIQRMIESDLKPTDVTWSVLITGCIKSNELEYAESVLQEAIEKSNASKLSKHELLCDGQLMRDNAYEKEIPETIEDILNKAGHHVKEKEPISPYLFTPIIEAHTRKGELVKAKKLVQTMCDLSVPMSIPTYTTLMKLFKTEKRYEAVEALWQALYKPSAGQRSINDIDPLLPSVPLPKSSFSYLNLLTLDDDDKLDAQPTSNQVSPFALSIYMDTLIDQGRLNDVESLWNQLTVEKYRFDEHNWNRYISFFVENGQLDRACSIVSKEFFESKAKETTATATITKTIRKRDDIFTSDDNQLHTRTCVLFADAFQIAGAENMGEPRLRIAVTERIKEHLHQKDIKTRQKNKEVPSSSS
jgi:pentatricopeptide repeat protein